MSALETSSPNAAASATRQRLAFLGSAGFSLPTLIALHAAGHDIVAVYTQPARPAGRGYKAQPSPVQVYADRHGLPVRTPTSLRTEEAQAAFAALDLDVGIVAAYGLILPRPILEAPRLGCLNVHASLLPRWRGAAPIQRAILAGDRETGITIMQMDEGLDTGAMLAVERVAIAPTTTASSLHDQLAAIGAPLLLATLAAVAAGRARAQPQPADGATYAKKLERDEGRIDWTLPADTLERMVRALNPQPGVFFDYQGERIKVLAAAPLKADSPASPPGRLLDDRLGVACGNGALRLQRLQRAGRAPMDADSFLRGFRLPPGATLS